MMQPGLEVKIIDLRKVKGLTSGIIFCIGLTCFSSCQNKEAKLGVALKDSEKAMVLTEPNEKDNYDETVNTVITFLTWYKEHYKEANKFSLVDNEGFVNDSGKYYSVNFTETESYLKFLNGSKMLSERYINQWRNYFTEKGQYLKATPQNDGPPYGFEFDFVLLTQEIDETLEAIHAPTIVNLKKSETISVVDIDIVMRLSFTLSKYQGKWLIDKIEIRGRE